MIKKIFRSTFFTSVVVLVITLGLVFGVLFDKFEQQIFTELESEAAYIAYGVEIDSVEYIQNFDRSRKRITLVAPTGEVVADTNADAAALDNHADRKEIKEAMLTGSGTSSRYSDTLTEKTLYYAKKLDDGRILRVSTTQSSVIVILIELIKPLLLVLLAALVISFVLSKRLSAAIIKPINDLDLDNPANNEAYDELAPLLRKIAVQKRTIDMQIKEAKQKQEEFKLITENMSEGLLVIDSKTNLLTYNHAALRLLEIDKVMPGSVLRLNRTKGFRTAVEAALVGERAESEITMEDKSYDLIATPVFEDGRIIGAVIVIIDVTESVRREQLRREFTSNVSHELKTPLTSISGFAEVMKAGSIPEETVRDFSQSIYDEAQRLISLVADIIKISELDEKREKPEAEEVDLYRLAGTVTERLKPEAQKRGVEITLVGESVNVVGNRKILDEIIHNLCDNAIKYNKDNGSVTVSVSDLGENASLKISDTGIGIPQNEQSRVFERFYRVDKSHSKEIGGTGLGLAIVKHAVAFHRGEIKLESTEGKGTVIEVILSKQQTEC